MRKKSLGLRTCCSHTGGMNKPPIFHPPIDPVAYEHWLDELVPIEEGARLRSCAPDTLRREGQRGNIKIYDVGLRKKAVRRRDALMLPTD